jgi:hypothetical protein
MFIYADEDRTFSSKSTDITQSWAKQCDIEIEGLPKQQIKISKLSLLQFQGVAGTSGTVTITAQQDGAAEEVLEFWHETKTTPQSKETELSYTAPAGVGVTLRWYLINSVDTSRAYVKKAAYELEYINVIETPATTACLLILCRDKIEAEAVRDKISGLVSTLDMFIKET